MGYCRARGCLTSILMRTGYYTNNRVNVLTLSVVNIAFLGKNTSLLLAKFSTGYRFP